MNKQDILNAFREKAKLSIGKGGFITMVSPYCIDGEEVSNWLLNTLTEFERDLVDEIKEKMYQMPAFRTIEIEGKRLEVLTKYQVANLLNIYEHTPFSQLEKEKHT